MGAYFRSPQTTNEQRQADGHRSEGIRIRAARRSVNLPDNWDDVYRSTLRDRSWKRNRRLKWRRIATV